MLTHEVKEPFLFLFFCVAVPEWPAVVGARASTCSGVPPSLLQTPRQQLGTCLSCGTCMCGTYMFVCLFTALHVYGPTAGSVLWVISCECTCGMGCYREQTCWDCLGHVT